MEGGSCIQVIRTIYYIVIKEFNYKKKDGSFDS